MYTGGLNGLVLHNLKFFITLVPHAYQTSKRKREFKARVQASCPDIRLNINGNPMTVH